jgi:hypothetical protein
MTVKLQPLAEAGMAMQVTAARSTKDEDGCYQ